MTAPLIRILLRYTAGALVMYGIVSQGMGDTLASDPDVLMVMEVVIGALMAAGVEGYYLLARRFGWAT